MAICEKCGREHDGTFGTGREAVAPMLNFIGELRKMKNGEYILIIAPDGFPGKLYRGRYCYEHLAVYWQHYGVVPNSTEIIHHIDGNKHNNDITNLQKMLRTEHAEMRNKHRGVLKCLFKCTGCGKIFSKRKRNVKVGGKFTCCSRKCIGITTGLPKIEQEQRIAENFIKEFIEYSSVV